MLVCFPMPLCLSPLYVFFLGIFWAGWNFNAEKHCHSAKLKCHTSNWPVLPQVPTLWRLEVNLRGATAVVTCQERIVNKSKVQPAPQSPPSVAETQGPIVLPAAALVRSVLMTTHIFRRGPNNKWLLMHRHASKPPGASGRPILKHDGSCAFGRSSYVHSSMTANMNECYKKEADRVVPFSA